MPRNTFVLLYIFALTVTSKVHVFGFCHIPDSHYSLLPCKRQSSLYVCGNESPDCKMRCWKCTCIPVAGLTCCSNFTQEAGTQEEILLSSAIVITYQGPSSRDFRVPPDLSFLIQSHVLRSLWSQHKVERAHHVVI